jgi:CheY-like chemotaxis protein
MDHKQSKNRTCLCVELDPDFFYLIRSYAERSGLSAIQIDHAGEALAAALREQPLVVFLEPEHNPERAAWDVLRELKAGAETAAIPVVFFSWLNDEEKALQAGANVYVRKPVMYVDFVDALAEAGIRQARQERSESNEKGG